MSRWISHGPRAAFGSTLAAGLTLILGSAGLAPAMPEPDGAAGPPRGVEGMNAAAADLPGLPGPRDSVRSGVTTLEPPRELPVAMGSLPQATARFEGTPAPGRKVTLRATAAMAEQARVRWQQIRAPRSGSIIPPR